MAKHKVLFDNQLPRTVSSETEHKSTKVGTAKEDDSFNLRRRGRGHQASVTTKEYNSSQDGGLWHLHPYCGVLPRKV